MVYIIFIIIIESVVHSGISYRDPRSSKVGEIVLDFTNNNNWSTPFRFISRKSHKKDGQKDNTGKQPSPQPPPPTQG